MLTFSKGKSNTAIAHIIPRHNYRKVKLKRFYDKRKGKFVDIPDRPMPKNKFEILKTIYVDTSLSASDDKTEPLLYASPESVIDKDDLLHVSEKYKLTRYAIKKLRKLVKNLEKFDIDESKEHPKLVASMEYLKEIYIDKLKTQMIFDNDVELIPAIDCDEAGWDGMYALFGPSGCSKTTTINKIVAMDKKKRPIILYTRISKEEEDPSLKEVFKTGRVHRVNINNIDAWLSPNEICGSIVIFDDVDHHPTLSKELSLLRDSYLETSRHCRDSKGESTSVICVSHGALRGKETSCINRECNHGKFLFPGSSKQITMNYLTSKLMMGRDKARYYIKQSLKKGRWLMVRQIYPNLILTQGSVFLL